MNPKILFIGTTCPFGDISGSGLRTLNIIRLLERIGPVKTVFATGLEWSFEQEEETRAAFDLELLSHYQESPATRLGERCRKVLDPRFLNSNGVEVQPGDVLRVEQLMQEHDVVWVHTLKLANAFRRFRWPKTILDIDDIPSRYHQHAAKHANSMGGKLLRIQKHFSARRQESLSFERFELVTICKEADRAVFHHSPRVHVVPNGFAVPEVASNNLSDRRFGRIGMIGDFNHLPNRDGFLWFAEKVWPALRSLYPDLELRLIGKGGEVVAGTVAEGGISGLGYVRDVTAEAATWSCMIVPTRMGGGTHLKVAEGLARRIPIVTTSHGARGYELVSGEHAMIANDALEFTEACAMLIREPNAGERLSAEGGRLFQKRYSWDSIQPAVERTVEDCLSRSRT